MMGKEYQDIYTVVVSAFTVIKEAIILILAINLRWWIGAIYIMMLVLFGISYYYSEKHKDDDDEVEIYDAEIVER